MLDILKERWTSISIATVKAINNWWIGKILMDTFKKIISHAKIYINFTSHEFSCELHMKLQMNSWGTFLTWISHEAQFAVYRNFFLKMNLTLNTIASFSGSFITEWELSSDILNVFGRSIDISYMYLVVTE